MTTVSNPLEFTALASVAQASGYFQSAQLSENTSNTNEPMCLPAVVRRGPSVDSTVQFIRANYNDLFKRLAD